MTFCCFFVSDLHGDVERYRKLFHAIEIDPPAAVFLGGDLLPHGFGAFTQSSGIRGDFISDYLAKELERLRHGLAHRYPKLFLIPGNDDPRAEEPAFLDLASRGLCDYVHFRKANLDPYTVYGYAFVPPTPFQMKDWEKYDVSRYIDPGCVSPEEGRRSVAVSEREKRYGTIQKDLKELAGKDDLEKAIFLFHTPPYKTALDRAALDGKMVDHVPLDVHVGSIAVRKFIETRRPMLCLHGHVHESSRLTGSWRDRIGRTDLFSAAYHGPELALVTFNLEKPDMAERLLL
ncbi:MAG: metallophosphoesterase [Planctomycetes bacterium]|nr:metallophosphoesterase [Planctomycetota bacterium]